MGSPRQIVDERLARGEITVEQYNELIQALAASATPPGDKALFSLSDQKVPEPTGAGVTPVDLREVGKGIFMVALGIFGWLSFRNTASQFISECVVMQGNSSNAAAIQEYCSSHAVKWPVVYIIYGVCIFVVISGLATIMGGLRARPEAE